MKKHDYTVFYENITSGIRRSKTGPRILDIINKILTIMMYILYPVMLLIMLIRSFGQHGLSWGTIEPLLPYVLVPGISFLLVSLVRDRLNWRRPYEEYEIRPLIVKETKGHSMPSRHVFSCTVIAMCILTLSIPAGILLLFSAAVLAVVRVLAGVHYPRDTVAGFAVGLLAGSLLFLFV